MRNRSPVVTSVSSACAQAASMTGAAVDAGEGGSLVSPAGDAADPAPPDDGLGATVGDVVAGWGTVDASLPPVLQAATSSASVASIAERREPLVMFASSAASSDASSRPRPASSRSVTLR
jgi:hypothetical protein